MSAGGWTGPLREDKEYVVEYLTTGVVQLKLERVLVGCFLIRVMYFFLSSCGFDPKTILALSSHI